MRRGLAGQRLIGVFIAGTLLFNYPLLSLFDRPEPFAGMPAVFVYMFALWAALIALMAWIVERGQR